MDTNLVLQIARQASNQTITEHLYVYLLLVAVAGASAYFGAYLRKRGENLATKEDISRITAEIEKVKNIYAKELEEYRFDLKNREQAAKIAQILAIIHYYGKDQSRRELQQVVWEASIWLPADVVRKLTDHLQQHNKMGSDPNQVVVAVRKLIHGQSDNLRPEEIAMSSTGR